MNSRDLFKKLVNGVKFDYKKYKSDARKFQMINENPSDNCEEISEVRHNDEQKDNSKSIRKKNLKRKSSERLIEIHKEKMRHLRRLNRIHVNGSDVTDPIESFRDLNISETLLNNIENNGYSLPTPVQMQSLPLMMERRELMVCAPTGSGKTLTFLIPIIEQLKSPQKMGFRAVILAPTRELAKQIHREALTISDGTGLRIHIIKNINLAIKKFGNNSNLKYDIIVTTLNRMVFLLNQEPPAINIKNVEWLIIDECDKLFEQSFRNQLSVIYNACSESSKIRRAMFSATYDRELEKWGQMNLDNMITVIVGGKNRTTDTVNQKLLFVGTEEGKLVELRNMIALGCDAPVLIFVDTIEKAKYLFSELLYDGINVDVIHSERTQLERDNVVHSFREGKIWFLICTELMGRGIDFKGVNLVINYDFPESSISYIHRIGRTGRAGRAGNAVTFFTESDSEKLKKIVKVMRHSGCDVPQYMIQMTNKKKFLKRKRSEFKEEKHL